MRLNKIVVIIIVVVLVALGIFIGIFTANDTNVKESVESNSQSIVDMERVEDSLLYLVKDNSGNYKIIGYAKAPLLNRYYKNTTMIVKEANAEYKENTVSIPGGNNLYGVQVTETTIKIIYTEKYKGTNWHVLGYVIMFIAIVAIILIVRYFYRKGKRNQV